MTREHWAVTVERNGAQVVAIDSNCLSGRELSPEDEACIHICAQHLLAFLGLRSEAETPPPQTEQEQPSRAGRPFPATCPTCGVNVAMLNPILTELTRVSALREAAPPVAQEADTVVVRATSRLDSVFVGAREAEPPAQEAEALRETLQRGYNLTTTLMSECPTGRLDEGATQGYHDALNGLINWRDELRRADAVKHDESFWHRERQAPSAPPQGADGDRPCVHCGHLSSRHACDYKTSDDSCFDCRCEAYGYKRPAPPQEEK